MAGRDDIRGTIGERMAGDGEMVFGLDGRIESYGGGPVPDAETMARIRANSERWAVPSEPGSGLPSRPLDWGDGRGFS